MKYKSKRYQNDHYMNERQQIMKPAVFAQTPKHEIQDEGERTREDLIS